MNLPFFYISNYDGAQKQIVLEEDTSKHIAQVLRMKVGEKLNLTDGKGNLLTCSIADDHKKHCIVNVEGTRYKAQGTLLRQGSGGQARRVSVAISLLKNTNRFEWFLEKATEIGVNEIIPLICERTEKEKFRYDRMNQICISAMLQSQQVWLPLLHEPIQFNHQTIKQFNHPNRFIAHCDDGAKDQLANKLINPRLNDAVGQELTSILILIGPEGDFTKEEVELALQHHFIPVSLGETRLRTETAGVVAATLLGRI